MQQIAPEKSRMLTKNLQYARETIVDNESKVLYINDAETQYICDNTQQKEIKNGKRRNQNADDPTDREKRPVA